METMGLSQEEQTNDKESVTTVLGRFFTLGEFSLSERF